MLPSVFQMIQPRGIGFGWIALTNHINPINWLRQISQQSSGSLKIYPGKAKGLPRWHSSLKISTPFSNSIKGWKRAISSRMEKHELSKFWVIYISNFYQREFC